MNKMKRLKSIRQGPAMRKAEQSLPAEVGSTQRCNPALRGALTWSRAFRSAWYDGCRAAQGGDRRPEGLGP